MPTMTPWLDLLEPLTECVPTHLATQEQELPAAPTFSLQEAVIEAEAILTSARAEAAELVADAQAQAEALREAAWQEGYHAGRQEAHTATEAELRAAWNLRKEEMRAEIDLLIAGIIAAREDLWQRQEPEMVALAMDISRQIIKTEVTQNPEVIRAILANAIRRLTDKDNVRIRVSVADAPRVKEMREDLMEMTDGLRHLEIIDDRRIGEGGCLIETNAGTIDAKIETQIAEVTRALGVG